MPVIPLTDPARLLSRVLEFRRENVRVAMAIVLETSKSTPVKAGASMLVDDDGRIYGTVGGGVVEAEARSRALQCLKSGRSVVFEFDLRGPGVQEPAPICGGCMRLLALMPTPEVLAEYQRATQELSGRNSGALVLTIEHAPQDPGVCRAAPDMPGLSIRFIPQANFSSQLSPVSPQCLHDCLEREAPVLLKNSPNSEIFIIPLVPRPVLLIAGGGHVGQAVASQANAVGFDVTVIDDRPEFSDPGLFLPGIRTVCGDPEQVLKAYRIDPATFIVIVNRGHQQDSAALRACIRSPATYIGMIGSHRKVPMLRQQFLETGWASAEEFDRVYAPIGLDIGATNVPEIATAIVAQLIQVRRQGRGQGTCRELSSSG